MTMPPPANVAFGNWLQNCAPEKVRKAIRLACDLVGDPSAEHMAQVEADKRNRIQEARQACAERRARREARAANGFQNGRRL